MPLDFHNRKILLCKHHPPVHSIPKKQLNMKKGRLFQKLLYPIVGMTVTRPKNQTVPRFDATWRVFNWATYGRSSKKEKKKKMTQTLRPPTDLKVSKSRKHILNFSLEPKNQRKYFWISALASKSGQIKKT